MATVKKSIVLQKKRYLKWKSFDIFERVLMWLSGIFLAGFSASVLLDVITRTIGHPLLWLQEVSLGSFIWGVFIGAAVAVRRDEHFLLSEITNSFKGRKRLFIELFNRCIILGVSLSLIYFGYINFLNGFGSFMMPSMTPIAVLYAAIPISGIFITLFTIEQMINGYRNGFDAGQKTDPFAVEKEVTLSE